LGTPEALRSSIISDLRPVRPLAAPVVRALWVAPLGAALLVAASLLFSVRADAPRLGFVLTWGVSGLETLLGLALIAAALREAVPGTLLPRRDVTTAFGGSVLLVVAVTWVTWLASGSRLGADPTGFVWRVCVAGAFLSALPPLVVSAVLVARAYPLRPGLAGALCGLGSGILADAGWRMFCHFANPAHVFGAHTLAIAMVTLLGAVVGRWSASGAFRRRTSASD
jgi:hypothetical protein